MSQLKISEILHDIPNSVKVFGGVALCLGASVVLRSKLHDYKETRRLSRARSQRQAERAGSFEKLRKGFALTSEFESIVQLPFDLLRSKLQSRELSATNVVSAFIAKSVKVNDEFNCVTDFVPKALKWAAELDALDKVKGPFHGIPICVKDDTDLEGMDTTVGISRNLNKPASESAVLVKILMDFGAVPICKTNCPQTCCSVGSHNPIYGTTLNPLNKKLSPGGSSSGTACLVAAGGVPFGTGGDTGGSMRIPAHWTGITALRPTADRLSRKGCKECIRNAIGVSSVGFVLSKHANEVALVFKAITKNNLQNQYDSKVVPIPWNEELFSSEKPLRIGYYTEFTLFPLLGDTEKTVLNAKAALESLGHTVVPFEIPCALRILQLGSKLFFSGLGKYMLEDLQHDEISFFMMNWYSLISTPLWKRRLLTSIPIVKNWFRHLEPGLDAIYSADLWDAMAEREALRSEILDQMRSLDLDLLLGPVFPFPAVGVDDVTRVEAEPVYTYVWNLVDFPAGVVRFSTETGSRHEEDSIKMKNIYRKDEMTIKNAIGMPIGVQLIGKPFFEEVVLRTMVMLDNYSQMHNHFPS